MPSWVRRLLYRTVYQLSTSSTLANRESIGQSACVCAGKTGGGSLPSPQWGPALSTLRTPRASPSLQLTEAIVRNVRLMPRRRPPTASPVGAWDASFGLQI